MMKRIYKGEDETMSMQQEDERVCWLFRLRSGVKIKLNV